MSYKPPIEKKPPVKDPLPVLEFLACVVTVLFGVEAIPVASDLLFFGWKPFKRFDSVLAYAFLFWLLAYYKIRMGRDTQRIAKYQRLFFTLGLAWVLDRIRLGLGIKMFATHLDTTFSSDQQKYLCDEGVARVDRIFFGQETVDYWYGSNFSTFRIQRLQHQVDSLEEKFEEYHQPISWYDTVCLLSISGYYWYWIVRKVICSLWRHKCSVRKSEND